MRKKQKQYRSWKQIKTANKPKPDDFRCLLTCMLEAAEGREVSFTIEDDYGNVIPIAFRSDGIEIAGRECDREDALVYLARWPADFERLFYAAAKTGADNTQLVRSIQVAKLADMSGKKKEAAVVPMQAGGALHKLTISRKGDEPSYAFDGTPLSRKEAEALIDREYISFLSGYKSAVRALRYGDREETGKAGGQAKPHKKDRLPAPGTGSGGRPVVDIEKCLGSEPKKTPKKMPDLLLGQEFLEKGKKGHVGIEKKGGKDAG